MNKPGLRFRIGSPVILLSLLIGCAAVRESGESQEDLVFSATGDGPREKTDWELLPRYFAMERADGRSEFLLHLGDICRGSDSPDEAYYIRVANLFKRSPIPVLFVPGDNEWNDHKNPDAAWGFWTRHFLGFERNFKNGPRVRHQPIRPENIAWVSKGVLLIGINLVGGKVLSEKDWRLRHRQDAAWVRKNLEQRKQKIHAAVVFAQARPSRKQEDFFSAFAIAARDFGKPVLYLHGDGHVWEHVPHWRAPNLLRVQVDQVAKAPPVQITITRDTPSPFQFRHPLDNSK